MALDSATARLLGQLAEGDGKPLHERTPDEARALGSKLAELAGPAPAMQRVEECTIEGPDGQARLRTLVPIRNPRGVLVYYHGGGWVLGSIDEYDTVARKLAERTSCAVVLVEYRLAPEHRYPAAVGDSFAALKWVDQHLSDIAGQEVPLIVAGDSAGGNLAAVTAIRARDRGGPSIALQVLIYPVTDADFDRPSYTDPENDLLLTRDGMIWFWDHYLPESSRRTEPEASPLHTENLSGLPPDAIAMVDGSSGSEDYLLAWEWGEYTEMTGSAREVADQLAARFNARFPLNFVAKVKELHAAGNRDPRAGAVDHWCGQ